MNLILAIIFSLALNELIHNVFEVWGMRQKVAWLADKMNGRQHGKWPVNIDSAYKTVGLHTSLAVFIIGTTTAILLSLNINNKSLGIGSITIQLLSYIITTYKVDRFHAEIGKLLRKYKV